MRDAGVGGRYAFLASDVVQLAVLSRRPRTYASEPAAEQRRQQVCVVVRRFVVGGRLLRNRFVLSWGGGVLVQGQVLGVMGLGIDVLCVVQKTVLGCWRLTVLCVALARDIRAQQ